MRRGQQEPSRPRSGGVFLGEAYVEEPKKSRRVTDAEKMHVAAVGTGEGRRWETRPSPRPAFMVCRATDAAI